MKKLIILCTLFCSMVFHAQDYQLFAASRENKIELKWMSKNLRSEDSFDIYKNENGSWQKINTTPVTASPVISEADLKTSKNPFPNDKSYAYYIQNKNAKEANTNKKAYANYQLALGAIYDNRLAKHLGIYFEDSAVVAGKTYQYKIIDTKTQKEISVVNNVIAGELLASPENVKASQEKQNCTITWDAKEQFMGYNVYRNATKVNAEPVMANLEKGIYVAKYQDNKVPAGTYSYTVKGISFLNTESKSSAAISITIKNATPPSTVTNLKGTRKEKAIELTWTSVNSKDIAGYNVLKSSDRGKTFQKVNTELIGATVQSFVDKIDAKEANSFQYCIATVDKNDNESKTMPVSVFVPDQSAPAKPENLVGKSEVGKITLTWKANTEKDLAGYRIYRGLKDDEENDMLLLNVTPQMETSFVDTFNEKAGTKFLYKIVALDHSFNESEKAMAWIQLPDVIPPAAPFLREATYSNKQAKLQWDAVLTDAILGYDIYRMVEDKETKLNTSPIRELTYTDNTLEKGIYTYYIKAIDSAKLVSKASNKQVITTSSAENNLSIVLSQEIRSKKVQITIEDFAMENAQEIKVFRKIGDTGFLRIPYTITSNVLTDTSAEEGVIYEYFVEIITTEDVKLKSNKLSINNSY